VVLNESLERWWEFLHRRRRSVATGTLLLAIGSLAAAGCSSSSAAPTSAANTASQTVTIAEADLLGDPISLIAQQEGYFAKEHIKEVLTAAGSNVATYVTSGKADLAEFTFVPGILAAAQGVDTTVIYATNGGANGGSLIVPKSTTLASLKALGSSCKIATVGLGTATYGFGVIYDHNLGLSCRLTSVATSAAQEAALSAGSVNGFITTPEYLGDTVTKNGWKFLINTMSASDRASTGGPYVDAPGVGFWGLSSTLNTHRTAIVDFLKAWIEARNFLLAHPSQAVSALMKTSEFSTSPVSVAQSTVTAEQDWLPTLTGSNGLITQTEWKDFLEQAASYGLPNFSISNPAFSYAVRVDTSYYKAAVG
jgi:ABC-type nitrate/sulfonate/bicarbonate transport system substrate-binding protein